VRPNEIEVAVKNAVVTLNGWWTASAGSGLPSGGTARTWGEAVVNEIEVSRTLELDPLVPDEAIKVSVSGGWITPRGEVEWEYQRREAERVVRTLTGVKGVTNLITEERRRRAGRRSDGRLTPGGAAWAAVLTPARPCRHSRRRRSLSPSRGANIRRGVAW
jgi:hypothetical protein